MERAGSLLQCYLTTAYEVYGRTPSERFTLCIGQREAKLAALLSRTHTRYAAFITAWHPCSRQRATTLNEVAQSRLLADLRRSGCIVVPGAGVGADGRWREPSLLALGLHRSDAKRLARRYRQNALLVCDSRAVPELIVMRCD